MALSEASTAILLDSKAPAGFAMYVMPFAATPQPRPMYPGPVAMQIPESQLVNVRMDGTTSGGGGLVDGLDFVWTSAG